MDVIIFFAASHLAEPLSITAGIMAGFLVVLFLAISFFKFVWSTFSQGETFQ